MAHHTANRRRVSISPFFPAGFDCGQRSLQPEGQSEYREQMNRQKIMHMQVVALWGGDTC